MQLKRYVFSFFYLALGRAAAKRKRAASGYPLQVLAAVVPPLLWAFRYYPSRWLTHLLPIHKRLTVVILSNHYV